MLAHDQLGDPGALVQLVGEDVHDERARGDDVDAAGMDAAVVRPLLTGGAQELLRGVVQLRAGNDDLAAILSERCEAVFFVDGQFVFEREIGFLPMTWTWAPTFTTPGTHYLTANVRGYEGHFGMTTLRVVLGGEGE